MPIYLMEGSAPGFCFAKFGFSLRGEYRHILTMTVDINFVIVTQLKLAKFDIFDSNF